MRRFVCPAADEPQPSLFDEQFEGFRNTFVEHLPNFFNLVERLLVRNMNFSSERCGRIKVPDIHRTPAGKERTADHRLSKHVTVGPHRRHQCINRFRAYSILPISRRHEVHLSKLETFQPETGEHIKMDA